MFDIILSHKKKYTYYAKSQYGWLTGSNSKQIFSSNQYLDSDEIDFLDYPFKDGDSFLEQHLELIKHFKPKYAVCPDIFEECKLKFYIDYAYKLLQYSQCVIIVPKVFDIIKIIPEDFIIGYSVPTKYGSTPITLFEIGSRKVHLLGGGIRKIEDLMSYLNVISFDSNSWVKGNHIGGWYYTYDKRKLKTQKSHHKHNAEGRVLLSIDALGEFWNDKKSNTN